MSMSNTASVRASLGALFGTVGAAANTITSTMNSAERGISMVDRYISTQETKQKIRHKLDLERFKDAVAEPVLRLATATLAVPVGHAVVLGQDQAHLVFGA